MTTTSIPHQPLVIDLPATRGYVGRHRRTLTVAERAARRRATVRRIAHTVGAAAAASTLLTAAALAVIL